MFIKTAGVRTPWELDPGASCRWSLQPMVEKRMDEDSSLPGWLQRQAQSGLGRSSAGRRRKDSDRFGPKLIKIEAIK
jgi:hypothetical protein